MISDISKQKRKIRTDKFREQGLCLSCGGVREDSTKSNCLTCRENNKRTILRQRELERISSTKLYEQRKLSGLCVICGSTERIPNILYCGVCKVKRQNFTVKYSEGRHLQQKEYRQLTKQEAVNRYGGCCACCQETILDFLTVDHVLNNGATHRKETKLVGDKMYRFLLRSPIMPEFQILCWNCQMGKQYRGACPHNPS